jgi:hypothetical protein
MVITNGESLVYYSKDGHSLCNNNSNGSLPICRLANHYITAQRVTIRDYNTHYDKIGNADRYVFLVRCHRCSLEWKNYGQHPNGLCRITIIIKQLLVI